MKPLHALFVLLFFMACDDGVVKKSFSKKELHFIDEYILVDSLFIKQTPIGGLSGIDYVNGDYYLVVDDSKNPRFLKASMNIENDTISSIDFTSVYFLKDAVQPFFKKNFLDLESIFVDKKTKEVFFVSEGSIRNQKHPTVFATDSLGVFERAYEIPTMFEANSSSKPKNNAVFEGSSRDVNGKGFWVAMEGPLQSDGNEPSFEKTHAPIRITYFDYKSQKATKQFAYLLEHITKPSKGNVNVNGVTAILEYAENQFFVVERTYQSGYGMDGNIIRIFDVTIDDTATNILDMQSLRVLEYTPVKKELLLDFTTIKKQLKYGIIDNIEGITLGPKLANGNLSLLLVADNNFQLYGKQLNQFIVLEIKKQ